MDAISDDLVSFTNEAGEARRPVLDFLRRAADSTADGSLVLDIGAGDAPYRELFSHVDYRTCDHPDSAYEPTVAPDIVAPAHALPLSDDEVDAIICTQVLEHVPEPWLVLEEFHRVLRQGGRLWLTAPLTWYLHEEPFDYYRYTTHGLRYLMERAGFSEIEVKPLNDSAATIAQLLEHLGWMLGRAGDEYDGQRDVVARTLQQLAPMIRSVGNFDTRWVLPINYSVSAAKPPSA